jgi:hypothetical protein
MLKEPPITWEDAESNQGTSTEINFSNGGIAGAPPAAATATALSVWHMEVYSTN